MKGFLRESFRRAVPGFICLGLTIVLFFCIFRFDGTAAGFSKLIKILMPFIYGGVMAFLLKTPYNWVRGKLTPLFKKKKQGLVNGISVLIVLVVAILLIYMLLAMVLPALVDSIVKIIGQIPGALSELEKWVIKITDGNEVIRNYIEKAIAGFETNGLQWVKDHILPRLQALMGEIGTTFGVIFGTLYNIIIGIIICVYILLSKELFARQGKMVINALFPQNLAKSIIDEFAFIDKTFVGFFGGKILDSAIIGLICYVFCLILQFTMGLHNAVLIAVIVGVTNVIPYFGPYIGGIPAALLVLMDSPAACIIFVVFIILLQQFDGNFLGPLLLSGSVGLSGFWVLFSITLFGGLMGFVGILIGVPVFAVIYDLIKRFIHFMLRKRKLEPASVK
jgi:predicted PurR-regulated permease PerM